MQVSKLAFIGLSAITLLSISACESVKNMTSSTLPRGVPSWVVNPSVKVGAVCSQARGVYPLSKAEDLAINSCLVQLSNKKISGATTVNKEVTVLDSTHGESVRTQSHVQNDFQVQSVTGQGQLSYLIKGKYYDRKQERVFVWIELK